MNIYHIFLKEIIENNDVPDYYFSIIRDYFSDREALEFFDLNYKTHEDILYYVQDTFNMLLTQESMLKISYHLNIDEFIGNGDIIYIKQISHETIEIKSIYNYEDSRKKIVEHILNFFKYNKPYEIFQEYTETSTYKNNVIKHNKKIIAIKRKQRISKLI